MRLIRQNFREFRRQLPAAFQPHTHRWPLPLEGEHSTARISIDREEPIAESGTAIRKPAARELLGGQEKERVN
jgi:hypothetical protein